MKKLYIVVIALFTGTSAFAQMPSLNWTKVIGGTYAEHINTMAADGDGNIYVAGSFLGTVDFDPGAGDASRTSPGGEYSDGFIAKFNAAGQFQWVRTMGGVFEDVVYGIAVNDDYVYATGFFSGTADFADSYSLFSNNSSSDIFLAAYDVADGDIFYAIGMGSQYFDQGSAVTVDADGNVYVTGAFQDTMNFDPTDNLAGPESAQGGYDMFLAKYSPSGLYLWSNAMGSTGEDVAKAIDIHFDGASVWVGGYYEGTFYPDPNNFGTYLTNSGGVDGFMGQYNLDGNLLWGGYVSTSDHDIVTSIYSDGNGLYTGGYFAGGGTIFGDFGTSVSIVSNGSYDGFVSRHDPGSKELKWVNTFGNAASNEYVTAVLGGNWRNEGSVYAVGSFGGSMDLDPSGEVATLDNITETIDPFIVKYNWEIGAYVDAGTIEGSGDDEAAAIVGTRQGIFWSGIFDSQSNIDMDPGVGQSNTASTGDFDSFIQRLDHVSPPDEPAAISFPQVLDEYVQIVLTPPAFVPDGYLLFYRIGSDPTAVPVDGTNYEAGQTIGDTRVWGNSISRDLGINIFPGTQYHVAVYSYNGSGTGIKYSFDAITDVFTSTGTSPDTTSPVIVDTSVKKAALGTDISMSANVTDATGIASVVVHFSPLNDAEGFFYNMTLTSGNKYEATIDKQYNKDQGIEYYITAEDVYGNSSRTPGYTTVLVDFSQGVTIPYSAGKEVTNYRIISVPVNLNNKSVSDVFKDELGDYDKTKYRLFRWNGTSTTELTSSSAIEPGRGYWFIAGESKTINSGAGTSVNVGFTTPLTISVTNGWNQIGNPYNFDVPWSFVEDHDDNADKTLGQYKIYEGSFANGTTLKKMSGGFIMVTAKGDGNLRIPTFDESGSRLASPVNFQQSIASTTWGVDIRMKAGSVENVFGGIGMHPEASEKEDKYDDFTLPRFLDYLEMNHNKQLFGSPFTKDIVPSSAQHEWSFDVDSSVPENLIELSWNNSYFGDTDLQLVLWDVAQQRAVDMKAENSYSFQRGQSRSFKVFYGSREYVKTETLPFNAVFHTAWPVPSTGNVTFEFSVPEAGGSKTNLAVYNLMGQKVANLVDQALPAGYQKAIWNIEDGVKPAAGVYISVLKFGNTSLQKRLIIK